MMWGSCKTERILSVAIGWVVFQNLMLLHEKFHLEVTLYILSSCFSKVPDEPKRAVHGSDGVRSVSRGLLVRGVCRMCYDVSRISSKAKGSRWSLYLAGMGLRAVELARERR